MQPDAMRLFSWLLADMTQKRLSLLPSISRSKATRNGTGER